MNQSTVASPYKRNARSLFLAFCLLQSASYACASQDLTEVRRLAEQGDATAQTNLGVAYDMGLGVPQNYKQAVAWALKAADQGQAEAQYNLGASYAKGNGVAKDVKQALVWYRKAAEQGFALAQTNLGSGYYLGEGVAQDYKKAVTWFRKAADQSDARASLYLGACYSRGQGVAVNYKQAALWFHRAAEQAKADSLPDIEKEAIEAARVADAASSLEDTIAATQVRSLNAVPKFDSESTTRQMVRAHYMRSSMTEDQFNRFGNQSKFRLIDEYSDLTMQYFLGKVTAEQLQRNQEIFLMEMKLSGVEMDSQDNDIVNGFIKNKLIKLGK